MKNQYKEKLVCDKQESHESLDKDLTNTRCQDSFDIFSKVFNLYYLTTLLRIRNVCHVCVLSNVLRVRSTYACYPFNNFINVCNFMPYDLRQEVVR